MCRDKITLFRPTQDDLGALEDFFKLCLHSVTLTEGLEDNDTFVLEEVADKMKSIKNDLESDGQTHFFLIAKREGEIIGTIAYGPTGSIIDQLSNGAYSNYGEIGSVFVHPELHNRGIGSLMLNCMYLILLGRGIKTFTLDSGYTIAKKIWTSKLGEPNIIAKDYWGEGYDHYVWCRNIDEISIIF